MVTHFQEIIEFMTQNILKVVIIKKFTPKKVDFCVDSS